MLEIHEPAAALDAVREVDDVGRPDDRNKSQRHQGMDGSERRTGEGNPYVVCQQLHISKIRGTPSPCAA